MIGGVRVYSTTMSPPDEDLEPGLKVQAANVISVNNYKIADGDATIGKEWKSN